MWSGGLQLPATIALQTPPLRVSTSPRCREYAAAPTQFTGEAGMRQVDDRQVEGSASAAD